ncbi:MAG: type II secretion system protein N [Pseudomonadota bacterium]
MIRTIAIGAALFVAFCVTFAPASLVRPWLPQQVELLETRGTVWNGSARVYVADNAAGRLDWRFRPAVLLQGGLGYHVDLSGPDHEVLGTVRFGFRGGSAELDGRAGAAFVNRWLAPYDIVISGPLTIEDVAVVAPYGAGGATGTAGGSVGWAGGAVHYRLSGREQSSRLPPLVAYLGDGLEAVVYPLDGQTPLLRAEMRENGFVWIGVTKMMTRLTGNPWPGTDPDHKVVLEVEQQLF